MTCLSSCFSWCWPKPQPGEMALPQIAPPAKPEPIVSPPPSTYSPFQSPALASLAAPRLLPPSTSLESLNGDGALTVRGAFSGPFKESLTFLDCLRTSEDDSEVLTHLDELLSKAHSMDQLVDKMIDEEKVRQAQGAAAAAGETTVPVSTLVHELRTPLGAIGKTIETLQWLSPEERRAQFGDYLETLDECYKHLKDVIRALPKLPAGAQLRLTLQPKNFTLPMLGLKIEKVLKELASDKNIRVVIDLGPKLENVRGENLALRGDLTKNVQIILNLAGNAIKYGKSEGGFVEISLRAEPRERENEILLHFRIKDNGPGIPPEVQARDFGQFAQGDARDPSTKSSGLGIYLTNEFLKLMKPEGQEERVLICDSSPERGTEFRYTVAVKAIQDPSSPVRKSPLPHSSQRFTKEGGVKLLCADDTKVNLRMLTKMLATMGCPEANQKLVEDGEAAVDLCRANTFDAVLLDEKMPKMGGTDAAKQIFREALQRNEIPPHILMLSGETPVEIHASLIKEPFGISPNQIIEVREDPRRELLRHFGTFGPGARVLIVGKSAGRAKLFDTIETLTADT